MTSQGNRVGGFWVSLCRYNQNKNWNAVQIIKDNGRFSWSFLTYTELKEIQRPHIKALAPPLRCFSQIHYSAFDASDSFQTSWNRGNKRLGNLWNAPKTSVWNIPQVNRFIGNRWWYHYLVRKEHSSKACSSQARMGRGSPVCQKT